MPNPPKLPPALQPKNKLGLPICGSKLRRKPGKRCQQPAGHLTDHQGHGRCWLHGGRSGRLTHGRYSQVHRQRLGQLYAEHEKDPNPLNILPEIALGRAMLEDYLNRYADFTAALLDWHQSYIKTPVGQDRITALRNTLDEYEIRLRQDQGELTPEQENDFLLARDTVNRLAAAQLNKPRQILDISDAHHQLDTITKMVERVERVRAANAISRADMLRVMTEFGRAVETYVKDPVALDRIKDAWLAVHL